MRKEGSHDCEVAEKEYAILLKQQKNLKTMAIRQFITLMKRYGDWQKDETIHGIKWGEQIQGHFLRRDKAGMFQFALGAINEYKDLDFPMMNEIGSWMFETTPPVPYFTTCNMYEIIAHNRQKFSLLNARDYIALTVPCIPVLGLDNNCQYKENFNNKITQSIYIDDCYITPFQRYWTSTEIFNMTRKEKVDVFLPIYQDKNTTNEELKKTQPKQGKIHLDAMMFGSGCCALQTTFSAKSLDHARYIHDQLSVLAPLFLALTAGTPFIKGKIKNQDVRWSMISPLNDDRTPSQRNPQSEDYLPFSRCRESNYYLSNFPANRSEYNDIYLGVRPQDTEFVSAILKQNNSTVDDQLLNYLAQLSRRDFLIYPEGAEKATQEESQILEVFVNFSWPTVRLRIPINQQNAWRVEFRPMEIQLTADQNSAFCLITYLLTRLMHQDSSLNLYIPASKLVQNYERAQCIDAAFKQKFFFRTNIHDNGAANIEELSIEQIFFGKNDYKGLFSQIEQAMQKCILNCPHTSEIIKNLKNFLHGRTTGEIKTLARWQRDFVNDHKQYTHNSILPRQVINDMVEQLHKIETGQVEDKNFAKIFPDLTIGDSRIPPHVHEKCRV